jgi:hypothetical protein
MACAGIGILKCIEHAGHQAIEMWPKIYGVRKVLAIKTSVACGQCLVKDTT